MTDTQLLTLCLSIIFPICMLIFSNSRVTDAKETLRAEMQTMKAEMQMQFTTVNNKLDHLLEVVANDKRGR